MQSDTTVTTLWSGSLLLQVLGNQLTTWGLDDLDLVRLGVVCLLVIVRGIKCKSLGLLEFNMLECDYH